MNRNLLIVGLGLIGGSLAKALRGYPNLTLYGLDQNVETLHLAERDGAIAKGFQNPGEILPQCDVVILCIPPLATIEWINQNQFRPGTLVTDVCGVKQSVLSGIQNNNIDYIPGHPMAGKESSGYENADKDLFYGANYILTPQPCNTPEHLALLKSLLQYIGCRKIVITTPRRHDEMIAYTSQLMHVVAAALCDNPLLDEAEGFSAGSLRDCTRVAKLDSRMWTELFLENKEELARQITEFEHSMDVIKYALLKNDAATLERFLQNASDRKRRYLSEKANGSAARESL